MAIVSCRRIRYFRSYHQQAFCLITTKSEKRNIPNHQAASRVTMYSQAELTEAVPLINSQVYFYCLVNADQMSVCRLPDLGRTPVRQIGKIGLYTHSAIRKEISSFPKDLKSAITELRHSTIWSPPIDMFLKHADTVKFVPLCIMQVVVSDRQLVSHQQLAQHPSFCNKVDRLFKSDFLSYCKIVGENRVSDRDGGCFSALELALRTSDSASNLISGAATECFRFTMPVSDLQHTLQSFVCTTPHRYLWSAKITDSPKSQKGFCPFINSIH